MELQLQLFPIRLTKWYMGLFGWNYIHCYLSGFIDLYKTFHLQVDQSKSCLNHNRFKNFAKPETS